MNRCRKPCTDTLTIPLDPRTAARLAKLSAICDDEPEVLAASLLHDVLLEDEIAHCTVH